MSDLFTIVSIAAFLTLLVLILRRLVGVGPSTRRSRRMLGWAAVAWIGGFALSLFTWQPVSADAVGSPGDDGQPIMSVAGYKQTWEKGYAVTTCSEFSDDMTSTQRFAAAADMLTVVWRKIETTDAAPSDTTILQYVDALEDGCEYPEEKIVEVAWSVWIHDSRFAA